MRLADGTQLVAQVQPATTRAGTYQPGQVVRLVLEAPGLTGAPIALLVAGATIPVVM